MNLKEKIKLLPSSPGVYLMKDSLGNIIYVGKSKNLKARVGSYFQKSKFHSSKVIKLVKNLKDFEYILTDTEFEALMLECRLIKEIKPSYNKKMKNPKAYCYIKICTNEKKPSIEISNNIIKEDESLYYGPYTSKSSVEKALQGLKEFYKISCNNISLMSPSCLNYSLGLCIGMCRNEASKKQYISILKKIIELLSGNDCSILKEMEEKMNFAADNLDFESAAKHRDCINSMNYLVNTAKVIKFTNKNKNIVLAEHLKDNNIKLFLIKGHKLIFSQKYSLDAYSIEKLKYTLRDVILLYFNVQAASPEVGIEEFDTSQIIYSYLMHSCNNSKHIIIAQEWISLDNKFLLQKINELF